VCACFAVRSAALWRVPVSDVWSELSGFIRTFANRILFRSNDRIIAPSILQSSKSFWGVNRQFILKPPSMMLFWRSSGASKIIIAPRSDLTRSSMTVLSGVPGETNFMKSMKLLSFSGATLGKGRVCFYSFMCAPGGRALCARWLLLKSRWLASPMVALRAGLGWLGRFLS